MHALINPVSVDFSEYPVELIILMGRFVIQFYQKKRNLSEIL